MLASKSYINLAGAYAVYCTCIEHGYSEGDEHVFRHTAYTVDNNLVTIDFCGPYFCLLVMFL